jgi:hypothetical protein
VDNDNDISLMRAEERGLIVDDHEQQLCDAHWLNCELATLLKLAPHQFKHFEPCEFLTDTEEFELCPPLKRYSTRPTLLEAVEEIVNELQPWLTALLEVRHQLRKGK